ncbi:methyltransferase [Amphritea sp. HPY]|uniref:methyltransferase n=1 Tax=Amphritea sp. HPY TaxID=3421652 RepID=UPI003D7D1EC4
METLTTAQGSFKLDRYPVRAKETLRAWDAADEYVLHYLAEQQLHGKSTLILNDSFGALSVALAQDSPVMLSDSYIAQQATLHNLQVNGIDPIQVSLTDSLSYSAENGPAGVKFDLIIIKITKSLAQLEDQLHRIRPLLKPDTTIVAEGMVKGIHTSTLNLFEKILGPTHTSLARKKARLIFCQFEESLIPPLNKYPKQYLLEGSQYQITNHANVFSREKLDIGTRFFIQNLPADGRFKSIIDLGCGNGIVGLMAAEKNPAATLTFVDESHMAVASAKDNFNRAFPDRDGLFKVTDCLNGISEASADLILNNPPFHQQTAIGDFIAWQMFKEARQVLKVGGEMWVIGNRHLGYHVKLKQLFGNCLTVASNKKFIILKSVKEK